MFRLRNLVVSLFLCVPAYAGPQFEPITAPDHVYRGGWEHFVGGGLAAFDCDDDDLPELFAAGGENPAQLLRNRSTPARIHFEAVTPTALALTGAIGAYPLDIDSDGILDLAVLTTGSNLLLRGGLNCSFTPFTTLGFNSTPRWTTAFSATWEKEAILPTLAFGNYVDRTDPNGPFEACDINLLYRPKGDGYDGPMPLNPGFCPLSMLFSDWGRNGRADLRVSNDRHYYVTGGEEQMWAMERLPRLLGPEDGWQSHKLWGMGIASGDLDRDGVQEVYLTSMGDQRLQTLSDQGARFEDVPFALGTTAHRPYVGGDGRPSTGWHVAFGDATNDGLTDIFVTKGNVEQMPGSAMQDPNNLLIQLPDGSFSEFGETAGIDSLHRGRGGIFDDLNGDGLLDIAVVNRRAPLEIWQNVSQPEGNWLKVALTQPAPNTRAVGAWIEVETATDTHLREITVGGGHAGGTALPAHFGLGKTETARVRVIWPDGEASDWQTVATDQTVTLNR